MIQYACPVCRGEKVTRAFVCGATSGGLRTLSCEACEGKGWLSDEEMNEREQRIAKHKERRAERLVLGFTMREMAQRLGVSLVDYSSYEHGRIDLQ